MAKDDEAEARKKSRAMKMVILTFTFLFIDCEIYVLAAEMAIIMVSGTPTFEKLHCGISKRRLRNFFAAI